MTSKITLLWTAGAAGGQAAEGEGRAAPAFTLPDAAGGEVSLDDYAARNVLLFFHMAVG